MKNIKNFSDFFSVNENKDITDLDNVKVLEKNTKERKIDHVVIIEPETYKLGERGADLHNKKVMAMDTKELNLEIDSQRLEYAWRSISNNLEKALKNGKIVKDGKTVAFNIKKDGSKVVYDFTFVNKDSTQNTDPSGKTTKNILAGEVLKTQPQTKTTPVSQVWVVAQGDSGVSLESIVHKKKEYAQKKRNLLEQGYKQIEGTYGFKLPSKGKWLIVSKDPKQNQLKQEDFDNGKYRFDVRELYVKYNISPKGSK